MKERGKDFRITDAATGMSENQLKETEIDTSIMHIMAEEYERSK